MMFHQRTWCLSDIETAEQLAELLTQSTWCGCAAFQISGTPYLYLNDATGADGAQEYAVLKPDGEGFVQVESITFSWCTREKALEYIRQVTAGEFDNAPYATRVSARIEPASEHQPCFHCR